MRILLPHLLREMSDRRGDAPALTVKRQTLGYRELAAAVDAFASGLRGLGIGRGDRVAVYLEKRIETVVALFGTSAAAAVFVPINPLLRPRQVAHILEDSGARLLVTTTPRLELLGPELERCPALEHVVVVGEGTPDRGTAGVTTVAWDALDACASPSPPDLHGVVDNDMAAILYTSGSTGSPKGVVLSHRNLVAGAESVSHYLHLGTDDVILAALPLSFDAGFSQLSTAFTAGAHAVLVDYLLPGDVVRACAEHGVTGLTCVPPLWIQLAEQTWPPEARASMRYIANTGGRMPVATLGLLRSLFPEARPYLMYGLTEAFRSTYLDPSEVDRRPDSIGKAIPNAEILVVRKDGSLCDPDEEGELVHRGPLVALGYWNDPARTAERFRPPPAQPDGLHSHEVAVWSGDLVRRDAEGFLYFVGRADEMIKTSGYRVSPTEVEEVVYGTGLVRDAVAVGLDDDRLGQHIVLLVSPRIGEAVDEEQLLQQLRHELPRYMVPQRIVVRDELTRSPNGKFDRVSMRRELEP